MHDPRHDHLAHVLVNHSLRLQADETVLIETFDIPDTFVRALIRAAAAAGARPVVQQRSHAVLRDLLLVGSEEQMSLLGASDAYLMSRVDAYIGIRGRPNISEWSDLPADKLQLYRQSWWSPVHRDVRIKQTRWVVTRWPDAAMAQQANRSTEDFEDFYFRVCTLDYGRMARAMQPLIELMQRTDRVRIEAPGTDLRFSIRDLPAIGCAGEYNIPDGEVFTAPVRDSLEGTIRFNAPSIYLGTTYEKVTLQFEQGKIVQADCNNPQALTALLDSDEGARYVGEFAIGFNPHITRPMKDILFDEKIAGSIHLALGNAYDEAWNGNRSQIHWDLVLLMDPEHGGGDLYFDDRLIRHDGRFVVDELKGLDPESLLEAEAEPTPAATRPVEAVS